MNYPVHFVLILLLIPFHVNNSVFCESTLQQTATDLNNVIGSDWVLMYKGEDGVDYVMYANQGINDMSKRSRFNISLDTQSGTFDRVLFSVARTGPFLFIESSGKLTTSFAPWLSTVFHLIPVPGSTDGSFHMFAIERKSVIVCEPKPMNTPPFNFAVNTTYPDLPLAEFYLKKFEVDVEELYQNLRENITLTAQTIHDSTTVEKSTSYMKLLELMDENEHLAGKEIFVVAKYIAMDLGFDSQLFTSLPKQVQLLCLRQNLKFSLKRNETHTVRMKYHWASDNHMEVLPFIFIQSRDELSELWAISYTIEHQLEIIYDGGRNPLVERLSSDLIFTFFIHLSKNLHSFHIRRSINTFSYPIQTIQENSPYYFTGNGPAASDGEEFIVEEFE